MASTAQAAEPQFDTEIGQFVAITVVGSEVYGDTWSECADRLHGANGAALAHAARNPDETLECGCVLPDQSCPACREAARAVYGGGDDPLPF